MYVGEINDRVNRDVNRTYRWSTPSISRNRFRPKIVPTPKAVPPRNTMIIDKSEANGELRKHLVHELSSTE